MSDLFRTSGPARSSAVLAAAVEAGVHVVALVLVVLLLGLVPAEPGQVVRLLAGLSMAYLLARMAGLAMRRRADRQESARISAEVAAVSAGIRARLDQRGG